MGYLDWQEHFTKLFALKKIDNMLEFGLGEGTKFLLDNCTNVTSLELLHYKTEVDWFKKSKKDYKKYKNWTPVLYECEDEWTKSLESYIKKFIKGKNFDMVFVDPGIHRRPEIINLMFGKTDIIAAHDTNQGYDMYKWERVIKPDDYTEVRYANSQGTTFWFKDKVLAEEFREAMTR